MVDRTTTEAPHAAALPVRNRGDRLGTAVVATLVDNVVSGRYPTGSTLPVEAELCDQFGVSRTVVRESVKLLQDKGLVRIRQGIGTVVCPAESWDMIDDVVLESLVRNDESLGVLDEVVAVRASLERDMAAAAAAAGKPAEQVERLRTALRAMERVADDIAEFAVADVAFHDVVMELSGRRLSRAIVTSIHGKARTTGRYQGATSAEYTALTLDEHRKILTAIEQGDPAAAGEAMRSHILDSWARRRPPAAPPRKA